MSLVNFFTNDTFFPDFDRLFDDAFARRTSGPGQVQPHGAPRVLRPRQAYAPCFRTHAPSTYATYRIDVHEDKERNLVTATFELPGMNKENVAIDVHNNLLTVSGESKFESDSNENGCLLRERRFGRFSRSLPVPEGVKVRTFG